LQQQQILFPRSSTAGFSAVEFKDFMVDLSRVKLGWILSTVSDSTTVASSATTATNIINFAQ